MQTAEAREVMLEYAARDLLKLHYAVICESGDVVARYEHPEKPPIGEQMICDRCDDPQPFEVEWDDVYLYFSPTQKLQRLAVGAANARAVDPPKEPRAERSVAPAQSPSSLDPAERATSTERFDAEHGVVLHIGVLNLMADNMNVGSGNQVVGNENQVVDVGGNVGDRAAIVGPRESATQNAAQPARKRSRAAGVITYVSFAIGVILAVAFIILGITGEVEWAEAIPAASGAAVIFGGGALLAAHLNR